MTYTEIPEIPEIPESLWCHEQSQALPRCINQYGISVLVPKISFHRETSKSADIIKYKMLALVVSC